ncbi:MAG: sulfite exporter TauE/SafE family protein [Planctomycetes bacterium]|nr:sulfite exporter TauE/SafE family protein [Planctomycetota bacterium]MBM4084356.1 sulfite exporter TauE/SafE family protein [Planctomycetota bacterium]
MARRSLRCSTRTANGRPQRLHRGVEHVHDFVFLLRPVMEGGALGLSTGVYCLASCVPVMLPYVLTAGETGVRVAARGLGQFVAGRFLAYAVLASLALSFGPAIQSNPAAQKVAAVALLALAALMAVQGLVRNFPEVKVCAYLERHGAFRRYPLLAGTLAGLNVCPPLMLCFAAMLNSPNPGAAASLGVSFFAGTLVFLLPLPVFAPLAKRQGLRGAAEVAFLFCGLWYLVNGLVLLTR